VSGPFSLHESVDLSCDVLIVGSGAGASTVAAQLVGVGLDVLMIEEGPYVPALAAPVGLSDAMPLLWRSGGLTAAIGEPPIAFAEGCCVGGGTEVNSAIFQRAPEPILAGWSGKQGLGDLTAERLEPYYDHVAQMVGASHTNGDLGPPTELLRRAGEAMAWEVTPLERAQVRCVGTNQCSAGCPTGAKQSVTTSLLPNLLRAGLRLIADCRVIRLMHQNGRASKAIAVSQDAGARRHITIKFRDIFVCAGATQSPALLQRSGMTKRLISAFQLHPTLRILARFKEPVNAAEHRLPLVAITEFMPDLRFGGSIFTLGTFAMALAEDWTNRARYLADHRHFTMYYVMIRPTGTGWLRTIPGLREPLIGYTLGAEDWSLLAQGASSLASALFAVGADLVLPGVSGGVGARSPAEFGSQMDETRRARAALMSIHILASLPMGDGDQAPVDSVGRLRGFDNVLVADASVIPTPLGANPQGTVMALAKRTADIFMNAGR
jgi:choline dehydrogenase-like flavoprotein